MAARDDLLCQLDGRGYVLDVSEFAFATVDPTRQGVDQGAGAGESSLSNQVAWRRVRDNWVGGAGQEYADLPDEEDPSSAIRFDTSTNLEAFERRQLTLHPAPIASMWGPTRVWTGSVFEISGATALMSRLMAGDASDPVTMIVVNAQANWTSLTAAPGAILASGDLDAVTRWRLRFVYASVGNGNVIFEMNTTGAGTAYDVTLTSDTFGGFTDGDVVVFGAQVYEDGADLKVDFTVVNFTDDYPTSGTHPATASGAFGTTLNTKTAASKAFPTWSSDQVVYTGKGLNVSGAGYVGSNFVVWGIGLGVDTERYTFGVPAITGCTHDIQCPFIDTAGWREGGDIFYPFLCQLSSGAGSASVQSDIVVQLVSGDVDAPAATPQQLGYVTPVDANAQFANHGVYLVNGIGAVFRQVYGNQTPDPGYMYFANAVKWYLPDAMGTFEIASWAYRWDNGFLVLAYRGAPTTAENEIWLHDGSTFTQYLAGTFDMLGVAGSRVLAGDGNILYEITATPSTSTIYTHQVSTFVWSGALGAPGGIYAWGTDGSSTPIYRIPISDATGALDPPVPAGEIPTGERVRQIIEHEGVLLIASSLGLRLALLDSDGSLIIGALLELGNLRTVCAYGRFAWAVDADGGFWKVDLSRFTDPDALIPAYESLPAWQDPDGIVTTFSSWMTDAVRAQVVGTGQSVAAPVFAGTNQTYVFAADLIGSSDVTGEIDFGWFTYGIGETLAFDSITVECDETPAGSGHTVTVEVDTPDATAVVSQTSALDSPIFTVRYDGDLRASRFKVRLALTGDATAGTAPVVRRVTLRAIPAPGMAKEMLLPLLLQDTVESEYGQHAGVDVWEEWSHLLGLVESRRPVTLKLGAWETTARVEGLEVRGGNLGGGNGLVGYDQDGEWLAGTWMVRVLTLD